MINRSLLFLITAMISAACESTEKALKKNIEKQMTQVSGTFAVAFKDLATKDEILIGEHEVFHAASTMKTPVMIEVYNQANEGKISLHDSLTIKNDFTSIADGSHYSLSPKDDSEHELYLQIGKRKIVYSLMYDMIITSSNLATNLIIELVDAKQVMKTMRGLGAVDIQVLRGVEDNAAFRQGLNNTTTAYDLMLIYSALASGKIVNREASDAMINVLLDQKFNDIIPALLPADVKVAHKTGSIKGIHHDTGIVILPDGRRYVLILLSKDFTDEQAAIRVMAKISEMIYNHVTR
ncbi:MAG: serine hydrolase [Chryseolinea sp.]